MTITKEIIGDRKGIRIIREIETITVAQEIRTIISEIVTIITIHRSIMQLMGSVITKPRITT